MWFLAKFQPPLGKNCRRGLGLPLLWDESLPQLQSGDSEPNEKRQRHSTPPYPHKDAPWRSVHGSLGAGAADRIIREGNEWENLFAHGGEVEVEAPAVCPFHRFVPHTYPSVGTNPSAVLRLSTRRRISSCVTPQAAGGGCCAVNSSRRTEASEDPPTPFPPYSRPKCRTSLRDRFS